MFKKIRDEIKEMIEIDNHLDEALYGNGADNVNNPSHYTYGSIEVIDAIEDWDLGYHLGNVIKYVARAGKKDDEIQDLKKAKWYLERKIKELSQDDK